jgi:hypothetical protein
MTFNRKDMVATLFTGLALLVFAATHEGSNVWLVGGSHRWAAGVITLLGVLTCGLGRPSKDALSAALAILGIGAGILAVLALVTGSLTPLSLLTLDVVLLWAGSMIRHAYVPATRLR